MTFQSVNMYLNNPANRPTSRELAFERRESERLARRRREWAEANGLPENHDPFAQFETG